MSEETQIPKHWKTASLIDELPYIKTGVTDYKGKKKYFSTGSIKSDSLIEEGEYTFAEKPSRANRIVSKGDVLQARMKNTDKAILIDSKLDGQLFSTGFFQIRPIEGILSSKYIYYYLTSLNFKQNKDELCSGSTQSALNDEGARKIFIPIPTFTEQEIIVSKIEELLSDLENGKQQLQTAQQQLKVYRQSLLKWAFEGKLTNKNVKDGELPKGWKWVKFGELFLGTPQNGLYKPLTQYGSGIPILRIDGFYEGIILNDYDYKRVRLSKEETKKYLLSIDDIVVNRVNSMSHLGKCGLVKSLKEQTVFESNVMKIQINKELALPKYITSYLACSNGIKELTKNAKHAVNQASINQTDVSNAIIPLPPLKEQQLIVAELESKLTVCDKIEETISQSLQQAETLRQSILKKAFEGKLVHGK